MQILSTKLLVPPLRSKLVARPRLVQKLDQGFECGFVLVSAPAGYGKSTLLGAWLDQTEWATTWLSLDDGDNHPVRFLTYLTAALRKIDPSVGKEMEISIQSSPLPAVDTLLTPLVNELAQVDRPFCLVLDDYHMIQNQLVHQMVSFLLEHRPPVLHLIVSTRADPPLPLARLRARSEMLELRQADLCFTMQEAADFLTHTMGLQISSENVARITRRTEGWIAGLQMASLSLQNNDDISGFITALTGSHHFIFDYLLEEVLGRQTSEIRRFLLYTSIVDQLTAALCKALLDGDVESAPARSSSTILRELDQANLFILPLDQERHWYRYHPLLSDLLRLMLEQTHPGLSVELHRRACLWYEEEGMLPEALQHAISSGDMQLVAQIISANVLVLVESNEIGPTLEKIDSLPTHEIIALPWLGIARAWALGAGQIQKSLQILDAVEKSIKNARNTLEQQRLKGHIAAARAFVLGAQGDRSTAIEHARNADKLLPQDETAVRLMNLTIWGDLLVHNGNISEALLIMEQALALSIQAKKAYMIMIAASSLATAHLFAGNLHQLHRVCLEALTYADDYQRDFQQPLSATAEIYSLFARLLAEWGEYEKAIQYAQKGLLLSERWGRIGSEELCLNYLGRLLMFNNDHEQARQMIERAEKIGQKISPIDWQRSAIYALESMLDCETPDANEISHQMHLLKESGASYPALLTARLLLWEDQPDQALVALEKALLELNEQPSFDTIRIYALRALAFQAKGNEEQALMTLRQALELAKPENRIATFVRENTPMEKLLRLALEKSIVPDFVQRLLAAFEARRKNKPTPTPVFERFPEPLSERELEVLRLLSQGCSDKKIAENLVIARETVHKHLKNIYGKLDVHSRTEALARANELDLL